VGDNLGRLSHLGLRRATGATSLCRYPLQKNNRSPSLPLPKQTYHLRQVCSCMKYMSDKVRTRAFVRGRNQ